MHQLVHAPLTVNSVACHSLAVFGFHFGNRSNWVWYIWYIGDIGTFGLGVRNGFSGCSVPALLS